MYGPLVNQHGMQMPQYELNQHKIDNSRMYRDSVNAIQNAPYNDIIGDTQGYQAYKSLEAAQQANAANQAITDRFEQLRQEKAENMVKISQLNAELAQLKSTLSDEDAFSRELAANRAKIGDIANSRAHQQDINNRFQWRWQAEQNEKTREADRKLQQAKEAERLLGDIEDIDIVLASPQTDSKTRNAWEAKKRRKIAELKALGGEYVGVHSLPKGADDVWTVEQWKEKLSELRKNAHKGMYLKQKDIDMMKREAQKWPDSAERREAITELNNIKSEEKQKAEAKKYKEKIDTAVAKAKADYPDGYMPKDGSYSYNGITVKIKVGPDGKNRYEVNGKTY